MDKWYSGLAPSMVEAGLWAPGDDTRLVAALAGGGAEWEIDWGGLVPGRSAAQVRRVVQRCAQRCCVRPRAVVAAARARAAVRALLCCRSASGAGGWC